MVFAQLVLALALVQQQPVPQPFPRPGGQRPAPPPTASAPAPRPQTPSSPPQQPPAQATLPPADSGTPSQASLGLPVYPAATFLSSFDAGQGQRYYLFGTNASFVEIVAYYKTYLKDKGEQVFDEPPTHIFEVGRFREETMVYPPGITVKDYTWNGSAGYLHVKAGVAPQRYKTIIQVVPVPTGVSR